jgi:hypothetical protein
MKYLIIKDAESGFTFPVFCVAPQTHADLATAWRRSDARQVMSAGFVCFYADGSAETFGESVSLRLRPRPEDAAIITAFYRATLQSANRLQPV